MYKRLSKTLTKKAEKHYDLKGLKCKTVKLEGFHAQDILVIEVFFESGLKHSEKMKLSEHTDTLNLFMSQMRKSISGFKKETYSKIFISLNEYMEKVELLYTNQSDELKKFAITQNY